MSSSIVTCRNHPSREGDYHCADCRSILCTACTLQHSFGAASLRICARCRNTVEPLAGFKPVPPFWKVLPSILRFPVRDGDWIRFLSWAVAVVVLRGAGELGMRMGVIGLMFGPPLFVAYYSMLTTFFYRVIARAEDGDFDVPYWPDFAGLSWSMVWPVVQFGVVLLGSFWPWAAVALGGFALAGGNLEAAILLLQSWPAVIAQAFALGISLSLIPMSLLVLGVTRRLRYAMSPAFIVDQIRKIPKTYFLATGVIALLTATWAAMLLLIAAIVAVAPIELYLFVLLGTYPLDGLVQVYVLTVIGHLLGYVAYQERFALRWWPKYDELPVLEIGADRVRVSPELFDVKM